MIQFKQSEVEKLISTMNKSVIQGNGLPKRIKIKATNGKTYKPTKKKYFGILNQNNLYQFNWGSKPAKVTYIGKNRTPVVMNYQDNKYQCACASFNMAIQNFGHFINENTIAKYFNTGQYGTSPSDMIAGAKKLGYDVFAIPRNPKGVQEAKNKGYGVISHFDTIKAPTLKYLDNYGHYGYIDRITRTGKYRLYDPTKGIFSIPTDELDHAMLNRKINYYAVRPL